MNTNNEFTNNESHNNKESSNCDVLVLGSGIAGLLLAHELAQLGLSVILACKGKLNDSNTACAQGGLSAVTGDNPLDSEKLHLADTIAAGAGLTDNRIADKIIKQAPRLIEKLLDLGVAFDRKNGKLDRAREGGHSCARILHSKDASGKAIVQALTESLLLANNVRLLEDTFALDLLMQDGRCVGLSALYRDTTINLHSRYTVLASGGLGQVFARTTNPAIATGDGIAMAYRAGASLVDMEFVQFHPTALSKPEAPPILISEAVRGAGAILLDQQGERFTFKFHKDGELATRDIVARAIYATMAEQETSRLWLDLRPIGSRAILERFPNIVESCRRWGLDPLMQALPIAPAAHYFMGGIAADEYGRTSVPGLFAIGECACTGLHGANRLASNSLLEGGVMALQAAELIGALPLVKTATNSDMTKLQKLSRQNPILQPPYAIPNNLLTFRQAMYANVGLERSADQLNNLLDSMPQMLHYQVPAERKIAEAANIALLGWLMAGSALAREESRGAHWRYDYPERNDKEFRARLVISKNDTRWIKLPTANTDLAAV